MYPETRVNRGVAVWDGGVLATAGNLIFQGTAQGQFGAFAADTGEERWSLATGSGGAIQFVYPQLGAADGAEGPTRLLAFSLDCGSKLPTSVYRARVLPEQPASKASAEVIEAGELLYLLNCRGCHGKNVTARLGGSVPELRYASSEIHAAWHGIEIGGARKAKGMPQFSSDLDVDQSEAIRSYVLSVSEALRARSAAR